MKWFSTLSRKQDLRQAVHEACEIARSEMSNETLHLALVFVHHQYADHYSEVADLVNSCLGTPYVVGGSVSGVIGGGFEIESQPAVSLTVASLPGVDITPYYLTRADLADMHLDRNAWRKLLPQVDVEHNPVFLTLADPLSFDLNQLLTRFSFRYPACTHIGGLLSGPHRQYGNYLYVNQQMYTEGAVGVCLRGNIRADVVTSSGYKPIGQKQFATMVQDNQIWQIDGKLASEAIHNLFYYLPEAFQDRATDYLMLGCEQKELTNDGSHVLMRSLQAISPSGFIQLSGPIPANSVVQFYLVDPESCHEDLRQRLVALKERNHGWHGCFVTHCQSRGAHLYGEPHHDSLLIQSVFGFMPMGGFFADGEIAPLLDTSALLSHSTVVTFFRDAQ